MSEFTNDIQAICEGLNNEEFVNRPHIQIPLVKTIEWAAKEEVARLEALVIARRKESING